MSDPTPAPHDSAVLGDPAEPDGSVSDGTARPVTGDRAVDDALAAFDRALADGPEAQAEAAAAAHRALQARLTAPTPPPPAPGEARPGPRR